MTPRYDRDNEAPDTLEHGAWRLDPRTRVLRWVADERPAIEPVALDLSKLIACPTCRARADQSCRTKSGHTTRDHGSRLIRRQCRCGAALAERRRYCDDCKKAADLASRRESQRRIRAAEKAERLATVTVIGIREIDEEAVA